MNAELAGQIRQLVLADLHDRDPKATVSVRERPDGLLDLTVVSTVFAGMAAAGRESLLWSILQTLPREATLHMTYSLLLTPTESQAFAVRKESD